VAVVVLVEHADFEDDQDRVLRLPGAAAVRVHPNLLFRSHREYGHRVGVFRVLAALEERGIPATVAIDASSARRYPYLVGYCLDQGAEFVAHGVAATRPISSRMSEDEERAYVAEARDTIAAAVGGPVRGWLGVEQSASPRTPSILDDAGFGYVLDWPNDEQPYRMTTPRGLVSVPTCLPLDDAVAVLGPPDPPSHYTDLVTTAFDTLARDGQSGAARCLVLVVRPWLTGRPYQIRAFAKALDHLAGSDQAWLTTPGRIAAAFRDA
jgi:allantoinase